MSIRFFYLLLCLCLSQIIHAQCANRYISNLFDNVTITSDVLYGQNTNEQGEIQDLYLDVYEPQGDDFTKRPLIILLHGEDIINGTKEEEMMINLSTALAKKGFIVASIDYRQPIGLYSILKENGFYEALFRGMHDAKAAVRFFAEDAANDNLFRINPDLIILGGSGMGATIANTAVYLDDVSEVPPSHLSMLNDMGGFEGNSGHPNYSSTVHAVLNLSGGIPNVNWIENEDTPLLNVHGTDDQIIPYSYDRLFRYTREDICNGHPDLCYRRLNEISLIMTHNSHAHQDDYSILAANQDGTITEQLNAGVRGLGLKLYTTGNIFCGSNGLYAYHGDPILGCTDFASIGNDILSFLQNNPREFLVITIEGDASVGDIATGFQEAGLESYMHTQFLGAKWPTLKELLDNGTQLIVMPQGNSAIYYHNMWEFIAQNPYNYQNDGEFSCAFDRGNENADLFLLNHFITVATPQQGAAQTINQADYLINRVRGCEAELERKVNIVYLDFFATGEVFRAVDTLNEIGLDFPYVFGGNAINIHASAIGVSSAFLSYPDAGHAPYADSPAAQDLTTDAIAQFIVDNFACTLSCSLYDNTIFGEDTVGVNSIVSYMTPSSVGSTYEWTVQGGNLTQVSNDASVMVEWTTLGEGSLSLIETDQFGCQGEVVGTSILVTNMTNIEEFNEKNRLLVFPNPFKQEATILFNNPNQIKYSLKIMDINGRIVFEENNITEEQIRIKKGDLSQGMYVLRLVSETQIMTGKIVIQGE